MSINRLDAVDSGLPRRLSVLSTDPHYDQAAKRLSDKIAVVLDGVELEEVCSYDVDKGEVVRRRRTSGGAFILDNQGIPTVERLGGHVEVRWSKEPAA